MCQAAQPFRDLAEKMRSVGISARDVGDYLTKYREFPVSHSSVQRHDAHFRRDELVEVPITGPNGEVTVQKIARRKLDLYAQTNWDVVPSDNEARSWGKLLVDLSSADADREKMEMLRKMFQPRPPALPSGEVIEGQIVDRD